MNKRKQIILGFTLVILLSFTFPNTKLIRVADVSGYVQPVSESEIKIAFDMAHSNNISIVSLTNLTAILNATFSTENITFIRSEIGSTDLETIDVLVLMSPLEDYTEEEISNIKSHIDKGNSLLVTTDFLNKSTIPLNAITREYGVIFNPEDKFLSNNDGNSSMIEYQTITRNFTTPITPLTENISQVVVSKGITLNFNRSILEANATVSPKILRFNPFLVKNTDINLLDDNNTIGGSVELENGARIVAIGSSSMFNNSYIEPIAEVNTTYGFLDNTNLFINIIRWLGRSTGTMRFLNENVDIKTYLLEIGTIISGNVSLVDSRNKSISQVDIKIAIERDGKILASQTMISDPNNATNYYGWVSTADISHGHIDVIFSADRVGYLPITVTAGRYFLEPFIEGQRLPDLSMIGLLVATVVIFGVSAVIVIFSKKKQS